MHITTAERTSALLRAFANFAEGSHKKPGNGKQLCGIESYPMYSLKK